MSFFLHWLKRTAARVWIYAAFCAIFFVCFALYGAPLRAVGYPALLCAAVGAVYRALDYIRARRRHIAILSLRAQPEAPLSLLPDAAAPNDADYQALIAARSRQYGELRTAMQEKYADTCDYYTMWAHQIKTPIAAMRLTLQGEDTPVSRGLSRELRRVEQYVEMAMMFLRLDAGTTDYVFAGHSLDEIVRRELRRFSGEFIGRKIALDYAAPELTVVTDEKWLGFVIGQLLSNALKYTPEGKISVYLEAPCTLCIRDTGIGIDPGDLPRIFEKGYTGANGRSDRRASGLGLYLCRRVCANLGVGISAQSEPGSGTVMRLDLTPKRAGCE